MVLKTIHPLNRMKLLNDGRYVNVTGDTMTGDLDINSNSILNANGFEFDTDVKFNNLGSHVSLTNKIGNTYRNLSMSACRFITLQPQVSTAYIDVRNIAAATTIIFRARDLDTSVLTECSRLLSDSEPEFNISRCGNITFLSGKELVVTNISGTGTLSSQTKYFPVDDGGTTRYIAMYDTVT